jgi:hypothetical protein
MFGMVDEVYEVIEEVLERKDTLCLEEIKVRETATAKLLIMMRL